MTNEERENAIRCLKLWIEREPYIQTYKTCLEALEQEPCIQEKQANADKIDAVYIDGFKAGYSQARFDLEQQPCDDAISRQAACDAVRKYKSVVSEPDAYDKAFDDGIDTAIAEIGHNVPPVTPQPKYGKWTLMYEPKNMVVCSECGKCAYMYQDKTSAFCPNCGAKMVEPQERRGEKCTKKR